MLTRIARVFWWIGLLIALGAIGGSSYVRFNSMYERRGCAGTLQIQKEIDIAKAAFEKRYVDEHPPKLTGGFDYENDPVLLYFLPKPRDSRETTAFQTAVEVCRSPSETGLDVLLFAAATIIFWTLAYILGGSFWLPSKRRT